MKCVRGQACRQQVNSLTLGRHQTQRLGLLLFFVVVCFFVCFFFSPLSYACSTTTRDTGQVDVRTTGMSQPMLSLYVCAVRL